MRKSGTLADRFRMYREAAGLSQAELARRLGKHASSISGIEAGHRTPSANFLSLASKEMHCDIADLVDPTPGQVRNIILIRSVHPFIFVTRTYPDREILAALGYNVGVPMDRINDLIAVTVGRYSVMVRSDFPVARVVPSSGDGLGPDYRERIYRWAIGYVGDRFTTNQQRLFAHIAIDGYTMAEAAELTGMTAKSAKELYYRCLNAYNEAIESEDGAEAARSILQILSARKPPAIPARRDASPVVIMSREFEDCV